jgi:hypothetical protein
MLCACAYAGWRRRNKLKLDNGELIIPEPIISISIEHRDVRLLEEDQ